MNIRRVLLDADKATLHADALIGLLEHCKRVAPELSVHLLTNGRRFQSLPERVSTHSSRHDAGTTVPSASSVTLPDVCDRTAARLPSVRMVSMWFVMLALMPANALWYASVSCCDPTAGGRPGWKKAASSV
jgi:hypothetical protein